MSSQVTTFETSKLLSNLITNRPYDTRYHYGKQHGDKGRIVLVHCQKSGKDYGWITDAYTFQEVYDIARAEKLKEYVDFYSLSDLLEYRGTNGNLAEALAIIVIEELELRRYEGGE